MYRRQRFAVIFEDSFLFYFKLIAAPRRKKASLLLGGEALFLSFLLVMEVLPFLLMLLWAVESALLPRLTFFSP